jgi:hypothetical protein
VPVSVLSELAARWRTTVVRIGGQPTVRVSVEGHELRVSQAETTAVFQVELGRPGTIPFEILPEVGVLQVGSLLGWQDVILPVSDAFNRLFVVRTLDVATLSRIWTSDLADLMASGFSRGHLVSTGTTAELRAPWYKSTSLEDLVNGIDLLRGLARADAFGIAALRAVVDGVYHDEGPGLPHVMVEGAIRIEPTDDDGRYVTVASTDSADDRADEVVHVVGGTPVDAAALARLGSACAPWLAQLGTARVRTAAGVVDVRWPTIEVVPRRLDAGVAILRVLGRRMSTGVFR